MKRVEVEKTIFNLVSATSLFPDSMCLNTNIFSLQFLMYLYLDFEVQTNLDMFTQLLNQK